MSQQNKVEQKWNGLPYGNDAGFPMYKEHSYNQSGIGTIVKYVDDTPVSTSGSTQPESGGVKYDNGKPDLSHISLTLVEEVARVREFGAKKYSRGNWLKGFKYTRSIAAALRHIFAFSSGQDLDPESQLSHISHAVCCLEHLLNDIKNHPENDDRK